MNENAPEGLSFTLSESEAPPEDVIGARLVEGEALSEKETAELLGRLPGLPDEKANQADFAFRKRSKPAPRTGETVETAFPPESALERPAAAASGPMELLRFAPEGDAPIAPKLSLTFSQPVVAVSGQKDAAKTVPASIEPAVEGTWRWVGTRTALFEPAGERFPMATDYKVRVDADLTSATGNKLKEAGEWSFSLPAVEVTRFYPTSQGVKLRPAMFMTFNQRVVPDEILKSVRLVADGTSFKVRRLSDAQIKEADIASMVHGVPAGQWVAFEPVEALPPATGITIELMEGAPSAEGKKLTPAAQQSQFRTYDRLKISQNGCTAAHPCQPGQNWYLQANNHLDIEVFSPEMIRVEPALAGMEVRANPYGIFINGMSKPRTSYKVTVDAGLKDHFGQTLGEDVELTLHVGKAQPRFGASAGVMTVLDPALDGHFPVFSVNYREMRVRAYRVEPGDWAKYLQFLRNLYRNDGVTPPGKQVFDKKLKIESVDDELTHTSIDLRSLFNKQGHGHLVLMVEPTQPLPEDERGYHRNRNVVTWLQSTDIALEGFVSGEKLLGWASNLVDGTPLEGVSLSLIHEPKAAQKTAENGLATLALPAAAPTKKLVAKFGNMLVAKRGDDVAFLPEKVSMWAGGSSGWVRRDRAPRMLWHVFDDRGMYQPGETVHVKGWLRKLQPTREGSPGISGAKAVEYTVYGPRNNKLSEGRATLDESGGFNLSVELPDDVNLGYARIQIIADGAEARGQTTHRFQIQEFRRPEFEVVVSNSEGPHLINQTSKLSLDARYYAGGGLGGAPVSWTVSSQETRYTPPGQSDYIFGRWQPWWVARSWGPGGFHPNSNDTEEWTSHTDAAGEHHLDIHFDQARPPFPHTVLASGSVTDVNRQTWAGQTQLLVHPARTYVGLRSEKTFVGKGEPVEIEAIVSDIDGNLLSDHAIEITAARLETRYENGEWKEVERDKTTCELSVEGTLQTCEFTPERGGSWRITAVTHDKMGRPNMTQMIVWVAGTELPPSRQAKKLEVELIPEKETYAAGETAKLLIQAPISGAEALVTVRQNGLVSHERVKIEGTSHTYAFEISEADYPNVAVQVDLVGSAPRGEKADGDAAKLPTMPAYASGTISLKVPPKRRVLTVDVSPEQAAVAPGAKTRINLQISDSDGTGVPNATVALIAVDEAILALTGYTLKDPIESFYPSKPAGVRDYYLQDYLLLATLDELERGSGVEKDGPSDVSEEAEMFGVGRDAMGNRGGAPMARSAPAPMMMKKDALASSASSAGGSAAAPVPIAMRSDFRPLALFSPAVKTDKNGKASVSVTLPDNLTRYRLMAVAVAGADHFGKGESTLTARLPLMVRPSPPRFLNFGDRIEMPVVVQNQTDEPMQVKIAARAANLRFGKNPGRRIEVPANDRVEVRFKAVTEMAGKAVIQVATSADGWSDAATNELPVWTPATTEAFATYGTIDKDGAQMVQPIKPPSDALSQFGGLEVTTSSTALQSLTDALIYLVEYPFDCSEQIASRVMGVAALRDVLQAFEADKLPKKEELIEAVGRDIKEIGKLQRPDGGFYLWSSRDRYRFPYVEVHITHALQRAKMKGFKVPAKMLAAAKEHIAQIERYIPSDYSTLARHAIMAYSYYVLDLMGESAHPAARKLANKKPVDELSLESIGWLMATLSDDKQSQNRLKELTRVLQNRVEETAATAQFTSAYGGSEHVLMHSNRRTDAVLLDAWMATQPTSDLIAKLVRGLLGHRTRGHWLNTQENVFVLLALDRYFQTYEKQTPDFVANLWLGDGFVGSQAFKGRTTDFKNASIPMEAVMAMAAKNEKSGGEDLLIQKDGQGRLYYRIGMDYALKSLKLDPAEYGFSVERVYEGADSPDDVTQRDDGTWVVKAGARVRVRVTMVAPARRYHVALVDPLPAGLEALNPALAVTEALPNDPNTKRSRGPYWWWFGPWYSHQNLRDERAGAFAPLVHAGVFEYSYVTRATTPGEFVVPPAKAEEMYHPETFGRSGTARMIVE